MSIPKIYPDSSFTLDLRDLRLSDTQANIVTGTVSGQIVDSLGATVGGSVSGSYITPGDVGGTGLDTVFRVGAKIGDDLIKLTVGATNAAALSVGDYIRALGTDPLYQTRTASTAAAGASMDLRLDRQLEKGIPIGKALVVVDGVWRTVFPTGLAIVGGTTYFAKMTVIPPGFTNEVIQVQLIGTTRRLKE